jgi:transcriptional regulator of acetoin/glycerol metabolism
MSAQVALLRVLEKGRLSRIGSTREIDVDVRLISTTECDFRQMCADGRFRQDLYYRRGCSMSRCGR